jgi:hypothetical protein
VPGSAGTCIAATPLSNRIGQRLRRGVIATDQLIGCQPVAGAIIEVDRKHLLDVHDRRPQIQDNIIGVAPRADVVPQHLGCWP